MENEILFRGKCIDSGEWVYGYYVAVPEEYSGKLIHAIFDPNESEHICMGEYKDYGWHEVNPDTICRCTGLTDEHGNLIFEHDYVRTIFGRICEVVWFSSPQHCGWDLNPIANLNCSAPNKNSLWSSEWLTVLDNKFDNTELMEG